jgi:hypothetical protein
MVCVNGHDEVEAFILEGDHRKIVWDEFVLVKEPEKMDSMGTDCPKFVGIVGR